MFLWAYDWLSAQIENLIVGGQFAEFSGDMFSASSDIFKS